MDKRIFIQNELKTLLKNEVEKVSFGDYQIDIELLNNWYDFKLSDKTTLELKLNHLIKHPYDIRYADYINFYGDYDKNSYTEHYDKLFDCIDKYGDIFFDEVHCFITWIYKKLEDAFIDYDYISDYELKDQFDYFTDVYFNEVIK